MPPGWCSGSNASGELLFVWKGGYRCEDICWLPRTSHALWRILDFVQVVRILQKTPSPQVDSLEASEPLACTQQGWEAAGAGGTAVLLRFVPAGCGHLHFKSLQNQSHLWGREEEGSSSSTLYTMHQCCRLGEVYSTLLHRAITAVSNAGVMPIAAFSDF